MAKIWYISCGYGQKCIIECVYFPVFIQHKYSHTNGNCKRYQKIIQNSVKQIILKWKNKLGSFDKNKYMRCSIAVIMCIFDNILSINYSFAMSFKRIC